VSVIYRNECHVYSAGVSLLLPRRFQRSASRANESCKRIGFETIIVMETAVKQWLVELDTDYCGYRVHELIVQYQSLRGLCRNLVYESYSYSDEFEASFMNHKLYIFWSPFLFLWKIKKVVNCISITNQRQTLLSMIKIRKRHYISNPSEIHNIM
jgi:hypothetical protein